MNPNAKPFTFNPNASTWAPTFVPPAAPVEEQKPAAVEKPPSPPEDEDDAIDENDPLWKATIKLTNGDRERAIKLLEDPDSLMKYPEIRVIMEAEETVGSGGDESWENLHGEAKKEEPEAASHPASTENNQKKQQPVEEVGEKFAPNEEDQEAGVNPSSAEDLSLTEGDAREHFNLVFIGHVDAGKSTLSGRILYLMGKVDKRTIEKFEREAKERNRESWFLAYILDTSEEERAKGITVEVGRAHFETEKNRYTILDAPGHKNYVPNMISGAAQADVGILVISARKGEFETGFEKGGQTREHALLARTLGVQHLVVVVNKMDDPTVEWDKARYEECVGKLKPYLKNCGYVIKRDVKFLPISGLSGDNILLEVSPEKCPWWKEYIQSGTHNTVTPTLLSTLDSLQISNRNAEGALRIPCLDRYFERGCVVMGKVESGTLRVGDDIVIAPTKKKGRVDEIIIGEEGRVRSAKPGENVMIRFQNINVEDVQKGYVLCNTQSVCPAVTEIRVQLALVDMLEHRPLFTPGYEAVMHIHTVEIEVTCMELIAVIDKGKQLRRPFARTGQGCIARLRMPLSTCMESFDLMPALGRLTLRDEGRTIAIGKIVELIQK